MAANDQFVREYAAGLVARCPELCPSDSQLYSNMVHLRSVISQRKMDYTLSCGAAHPEGCRLAAQLTVWNEFLWPIDVEIRETRPGRFAVCRLLSRIVPIASGMQRRHACVLVHWLLTRHHCVEFLEIWKSRIPRRHSLFCDALGLSHGLRHIKFCNYGLNDPSPEQLIAALTATIATLNTLEIVNVHFSNLSVRLLCDFLGGCEVLSTLVLLENWVDPPKAEALAKSIARCSSLENVHVDEQFLTGDTCSALVYLVSSSAHVKELTVSRSLLSGETGSSHGFGTLFLALAKPDTQLEKLNICNFVLNQADLNVLAAALRCNGRLKCLRLLCSGASQGVCFSLDEVVMHNASLADICVKSTLVNQSSLRGLASALEANTTLKTLALDDARLRADETMGLIDALTVNTTLEKCHLGKICQPGLVQFLKTIRHKDLTARLDFAAVFAKTADLLGTLKNNFYKLYSLRFEPAVAIKQPELQRLSNGLWCNTSSLRSLAVRLPCIDCNLALTLSTVLSSCKHLREVCFDFPAKALEVVVLMGGLRKTRRLDELTIRGWAFEYTGAGSFSDMLRTTRSLTKVTFEVLTPESRCYLMMELRRGLIHNYTVLKASVFEHPEEEKSVFETHEYLRRNQSLLMQALRFIVPPASTAKNAAAAFEKVQGSRALVKEVSRLAGLSEAEAAELVTCRRRYLDINYLAIAGVVKEKVECHRTEAGHSAVQFDQISMDCWLQIRRYLNIEDVLDDPWTPNTRSLKRKLMF